MTNSHDLRHALAALEDLCSVLDQHRHSHDLLTDRAIRDADLTLRHRLAELTLEVRQTKLF
jgi:hypothetical protein